jgi:hypothetical protein
VFVPGRPMARNREMERAGAMPGKAPKIGPYSRPHTLAKLDQRTREAAMLRRIRAEMAEWVGGNPSAGQIMAIDRLAIVTLRLALFDQKIALGQPITDHDSRSYHALHNMQRLLLRDLPGLKAQPAAAPSLADLVADMQHRKGAAAA